MLCARLFLQRRPHDSLSRTIGAILIPVKSFADSKQRLADHYSAVRRLALAAALCEDFFRIVAGVRGVDRVFVVSQEPGALAWARRRSARLVREPAREGVLERGCLVDDRIVTKREVRPALPAAQVV